MENRKKAKVRGVQRFAALTYPWIAAMTDLKASTVQVYARRGLFDRNDLADVLRWINTRRVRAGLPMIGVPEKDSL